MMVDRPANERPSRPMTGQLIVGLSIVAAGILFTLDNLGILDARDYLRFWPLVISTDSIGTCRPFSAR